MRRRTNVGFTANILAAGINGVMFALTGEPVTMACTVISFVVAVFCLK